MHQSPSPHPPEAVKQLARQWLDGQQEVYEQEQRVHQDDAYVAQHALVVHGARGVEQGHAGQLAAAAQLSAGLRERWGGEWMYGWCQQEVRVQDGGEAGGRGWVGSAAAWQYPGVSNRSSMKQLLPLMLHGGGPACWLVAGRCLCSASTALHHQARALPKLHC